MMNDYIVLVTDTYAGEANFGWAYKHKIKAKSKRHALTIAKMKRWYSPVPRHRLSDYGDELRADIVNKNIVFFVTDDDGVVCND